MMWVWCLDLAGNSYLAGDSFLSSFSHNSKIITCMHAHDYYSYTSVNQIP